ncbi:MAG: phosphoenolpyruvate carboxykinase (GTP) [Planctomycetes bacterium]|nr:phosphoenolpyruvate carboxykinase (GTP) [Planctomycetota bacterium]
MALQDKLKGDNYEKLMALPNPKLHGFVEDAVELCNPDSVFVCTDSDEDIRAVRQMAIDLGEELPLKIEGHTIHFDGFETMAENDQGRDKDGTRYLLPPGMDLGERINSIDRETGLREIRGFLQNSMQGKQMLVRFFCLGPTNSEFSISGVQLTDSAYVAHSEDLLYRAGYEQFKTLGDSPDFFRVLHSAGELKGHVSAHMDKRRIYIDIEEDLVYSVNTQYAGNTVGFKKLCLRLAIRKADREGWLAEHMLLMGAHGPSNRVTYFAGAFPSACGKTSTAMLPGETIVGDDLAYLRKKKAMAYAVNVESGIFGIIRDVNPDDDPVIWDCLTKPGEVIFTNVLMSDGTPYWLGDGRELPEKGVNYSGEWRHGKQDADGTEIPPAHPNARYTIRLEDLANLDERWDDAAGVRLGGIIYGGRDSDTWVPVAQSFDWPHGVITMGAALESESTAATLGAVGVRAFQPMSNLDFVALPLGRYIQNHLDFGQSLDTPPLIFGVNYFQKNREGKYLTGMLDKAVWVKWMELRVHGDVDAVPTPTGLIPKYDDLARLFRDVRGQDYTKGEYVEQFTLRIPESQQKIERIDGIYRTQVTDTPQIVFDVLAQQRQRLTEARKKHGDYVSPFDIAP